MSVMAQTSKNCENKTLSRNTITDGTMPLRTGHDSFEWFLEYNGFPTFYNMVP